MVLTPEINRIPVKKPVSVRRRGLSLPLGVDASGRAKTSIGQEENEKIIAIALGSGELDNPFLDIGIGERFVFNISGPETRGQIVQRAKRVFRRLQALQRFRLIEDTVRVIDGDEPGVLLVTLQYIDLEADEPRDVAIPLHTENF